MEAVEPYAASSGGLADEEAVRKVVGGESAVFGVLVERYKDRLYNTVYRLVGCAEDARDVVQETFVSAYENLEGFRGTSSLYTWLFRIAVNASLSHRRKRRWTRPLAPLDGDGGEGRAVAWQDPAAPDPADPLVAAETEALVQQALAGLDEDHRTVVVLRDIQHLDYRQIAEILAVPAGTVKSRLHRARLTLREKLRPLLRSVM